jgi:hypothetical protein
MKRFFAAILAVVCVVGFASDGFARKGAAHRSGAKVVRDPSVLLGSPTPQTPYMGSRIPAPLPPPPQAPVINGPSLRSPYGGVM